MHGSGLPMPRDLGVGEHPASGSLQGKGRQGKRHVKKNRNWWVEGQFEKVKMKRDGVEKDGYKCKACNKQLIASNQQPPQGARPQSQHLCVVVQTGGGTLMREGFLRNTFRVAGSC